MRKGVDVMEKLITFAVPCYNSAAFMNNCIDSVLGLGGDTEIIIIDDGSKDETGKIADEYAKKYPDTVRAIHQENGGHGEGVNQGIRNARGKYYKVIDSDDALDRGEAEKLLARIRENEALGEEADMYICNYVYVRSDTGERRVMGYGNIFPEEKFVSWDETKAFGVSQYLMMHSVVYRTDLLREHKCELPKHTFYVDNLYMYHPFPFVKRIYYMNLNLYLYNVGSEGQSVNEKNLVKNIDQQVLVTKLMIGCHDLGEVKRQSRRLHRYMIHELAMMVSICNVFLYVAGGKENVKKAKDLWKMLKERDKKTCRQLKYRSIAGLTALPGAVGRKITVVIYRIVDKIYKVH